MLRQSRQRVAVGLGVTSLVGFTVLLTGVIWWHHRQKDSLNKPSAVSRPATALPPKLQEHLEQAASAPPKEAISLYRRVVRHKPANSSEAYVVGYAHYQIGKLYAEQKQYRLARQAFQHLAEQRISEPALPIDPSFGTWSEQGAYQAAICAYQLDPEQGIQQMVRFMEEHPDSPLVYGAYKRILRWTNEKPPAAAQRAWEKVQIAQRERLKRSAACGPKALAYLLTHEFAQPTDWQQLMQECETGIEGTSLWALAEAARKRGLSAVGLAVSRKGLLEQSPPFIVWNPMGHYVAVVVREGVWQVYDPEKGTLEPWIETAIPEFWRGAVLVLRQRDAYYAKNGGTQR